MSYNLFLIAIIGHVLGDYYFQSQKLADYKDEFFLGVVEHSLLYSLAMFIIVLSIKLISHIITYRLEMKVVILYALIFSVLHFFIDAVKYEASILFVKKKSKKETMNHKRTEISQKKIKEGYKEQIKPYVYVVDQLLHIVVIILVILKVIKSGYSFFIPEEIEIGIRMLTGLLIIFKPTNITFNTIIKEYKPEIKQKENEIEQSKNEKVIDRNAGRSIGNLERLLVFLLLMANQYSAIGFIFAAKSITRYDRIVHEQEFAEYYLLGTLFSITATIIVYFIFSNGLSIDTITNTF
ncbi:DUF3307 domain-containing protein [Gottschalkiaceae bacterium SANA]|nr:DUF3307 domain-containing protein [Gottschalkiaceae bacterium SANA]